MRILDAFCGEGGAGQGYADAGWDVYGVDMDAARLAHYPHPSTQGDAVAFILEHGHEFDAIHASPPCQGYSRGTAALPDRFERYDRLIAATREALESTGLPYVIENVEDAKSELVNPALLCGRMFGLGAVDTDGTPLVLDRHRLFESNVPLMVPPHPKHDRRQQVAGVYGGARRDKVEARTIRKGGYVPASLEVLRTLIGAPWMTEKGCFLSIPPVYAEFIGEQLMRAVQQSDGDWRADSSREHTHGSAASPRQGTHSPLHTGGLAGSASCAHSRQSGSTETAECSRQWELDLDVPA